MVHSESRNAGNRVATCYDSLFKSTLQKQGIDTNDLKGENNIPIESKEGQHYFQYMEWF